ncbi:MAG: hypothetical protein KBS57_00410, partial [Alistipes sp.]|nr:hypothetical protein [Candidatus Minthomonas equi]
MKHISILTVIILSALSLSAEEFNSGLSRLETAFYICPRAEAQHIDMSADWHLYSLDTRIESTSELQGKEFINVASPTSVQMAYYKAGKLPAPYEHLNSNQYKYLEQQAHYYCKTFKTPAVKEGDNVYFSFDGVDYDSKVWVNGKCIGAHTGMFGGPTININPFLKGAGMENEIVIEVLSANYKHPELASRGTHDRMHSWYFSNSYRNAPPFYHVGMWNTSRLDILPRYHVERPFLSTKKIANGKATLDFSAELFAGTSSSEYELNNKNMGHYGNPLT